MAIMPNNNKNTSKMKKYIGTKHIEAEPMTMGEAYEKNLLQAGRVPNESEKDNAGYHVKYEDGYESWSPAEPFEKAYQVADTPLDRMTIEENELTDRMKKLTSFISGNKFKELDSATRSMLTSQYESMREYLAALCMRSTKMESGEGSYTNFSFGVAVNLLKQGFVVRRQGWNCNMFIVKQVPAHIDSVVIPKMQSLPQSAKDLILCGKGYINYTSQCLIYNENTGRADSWVPSISDIFAEDWEIVE